jgi:hypothetical protein
MTINFLVSSAPTKKEQEEKIASSQSPAAMPKNDFPSIQVCTAVIESMTTIPIKDVECSGGFASENLKLRVSN